MTTLNNAVFGKATFCKAALGNSALAMVRIGMIGCIVKLTLLWEPVISTGSLASVIGRAFIG